MSQKVTDLSPLIHGSSMTDIPYKYYRVVCDKVRLPDYYFCISEFRIYESRGSANLALTAIASASSEYSPAYASAKVNDGIASTEWSSVIMTGANTNPWIKLTLPEPKVIRSFDMIASSNVSQTPVDYVFQASNDDINWVDIFKKNGNASNDIIVNLSLKKISGSSFLSNSEATDRVIVSDWATGELVDIVEPQVDGSFVCYTDRSAEVLVVHIGPVGSEPKSDGPITVY